MKANLKTNMTNLKTKLKTSMGENAKKTIHTGKYKILLWKVKADWSVQKDKSCSKTVLLILKYIHGCNVITQKMPIYFRKNQYHYSQTHMETKRTWSRENIPEIQRADVTWPSTVPSDSTHSRTALVDTQKTRCHLFEKTEAGGALSNSLLLFPRRSEIPS